MTDSSEILEPWDGEHKRTETCEACGKDFTFEVKAGRPPKRCLTCRENNIKRRTSESLERALSIKERVDRLEFLLKSRNTHISQHRDE